MVITVAFRARLREDTPGVLCVIALVSKSVMPVRVPATQVFSHMLGVFATGSYADQAILSSSLHQFWAITYGSGMRNDPRYTPSDVFDTFPSPRRTSRLERIGRVLEEERRKLMARRNLGITKLYNRVNDPSIDGTAERDVGRLRAIHEELDRCVLDAYGWSSVEPDHGFHTYRQVQRWTIAPASRVELLDRLLAENQRRSEGALPV